MPTPSTRTEKLDLRLTPAAKLALVAAAGTDRRSVSEFVLASALARAQETLALRRHFGLSAEKWDAFIDALDATPRELPRVEQLFLQPSLFEGGPSKSRCCGSRSCRGCMRLTPSIAVRRHSTASSPALHGPTHRPTRHKPMSVSLTRSSSVFIRLSSVR